MKKIAKFSSLLLALLLMIPVSMQRTFSKASAGVEITGDLYGAARIKATATSETDVGYVSEINVGGAGNADYSGTGIFIRMKNYTTIETPITFKINSTNGVLVGPTTGVDQTYFDASGNATTGSTARGWGNYLMLPASFDGFVYMNYSSQMSKIGGTGDFDPAHIWRIYVEYSGHYDAYADFAIGDIFTDTKRVLDTSELSESDFATTFISQTANQTITQLARSEDFIPEGDLKGGVHAIQPANVSDGYGGFMIKSSNPVDLSTGLYIRIKGLTEASQWLMIHVASDFFANRCITTNGGVVTYHAANGNVTGTATVNEWGYFELPAKFDGFISFAWTAFAGDAAWAGSDFHSNTVIAVYFEAAGLQVEVGDILSKDNVFFDGSEHYETEFGTLTETWSGCLLTILDGYKEPEVVLYDYTQVTYAGELEGGVTISAKQNPDNTVFSSASIKFKEGIDLSEGEAIAINMIGRGSYAFGLEFEDVNGNVLRMPEKAKAAVKPIYFIKDGAATTMNHTNGDENTIHEVAGTGVVVIEKAFLDQKSGDDFAWTQVKEARVIVHTHYDSGINISLGDIGTVDQASKTHTVVFEVGKLLNWSTYYVANDEFINVKQYFVPKASPWIGDVKIIDSMNYKDDEEMNAAISYDDGNNPCSYHRQDDGLFVHAGPFETGHAYGSYMCLPLFDKGVTTDRKVAYRMVEEVKEYAKGLTFYAKNLSKKEIGVTLQFDENIPGKGTERWCITGYPALYYAWDVNTNENYLMYAKSDQVQIPVGFEGYIRVPFESYSVPEWNKGAEGVDEVLNLDNFSGNFFFTCDNSRYEDLEFFIKNIGMYFNNTVKGNMFNTQNTIKANMGL